MSDLVHTLNEVEKYLAGVQTWVLKSKEGLTRDQAKRIFQRYHGHGTEEQDQSKNGVETASTDSAEQQSRQIQRVLQYMELTTQRLNLIESDIGYIKEKVDAILKKL